MEVENVLDVDGVSVRLSELDIDTVCGTTGPEVEVENVLVMSRKSTFVFQLLSLASWKLLRTKPL